MLVCYGNNWMGLRMGRTHIYTYRQHQAGNALPHLRVAVTHDLGGLFDDSMVW